MATPRLASSAVVALLTMPNVSGSPHARVHSAGAAVLHDPLLAGGITPDEYDRYMAALDDPDVIVPQSRSDLRLGPRLQNSMPEPC